MIRSIKRAVYFAAINYLESVVTQLIGNLIWFFPFTFLLIIAVFKRQYPVVFSSEIVNDLFFFCLASAAVLASPFSSAVYKNNIKAARQERITLTGFFINAVKSFLFSILLFLILAIIIFLLFNAGLFYTMYMQKINALSAYILSACMCVIAVFFFSIIINIVFLRHFPEILTLRLLLKEALSCTIHALPVSVFNMFLFIALMFVSFRYIWPFALLLPSFWGQYQAEHILNVRECLQNMTPRVPARTLSNIFNPWKNFKN